MIAQITKTANGYEIILDGQTLFVPEAGGNRHYQMVLEAIANGQPVLDPPAPPPPTQEQQEANRQAAYSAEADPIAMQMLRDEATKEEWLAKIDEIKARYPYPEYEEKDQ
jgi:hypothetical protein